MLAVEDLEFGAGHHGQRGGAGGGGKKGILAGDVALGQGGDEVVPALAREIKLELAAVDEIEAAVDIPLAEDDFTGVQRERLLGEVEGIGFLFGKLAEEGLEDLQVILIDGAAFFRFDDFRGFDDFGEGHVVHGHQPFPHGFRFLEVLGPGMP